MRWFGGGGKWSQAVLGGHRCQGGRLAGREQNSKSERRNPASAFGGPRHIRRPKSERENSRQANGDGACWTWQNISLAAGAAERRVRVVLVAAAPQSILNPNTCFGKVKRIPAFGGTAEGREVRRWERGKMGRWEGKGPRRGKLGGGRGRTRRRGDAGTRGAQPGYVAASWIRCLVERQTVGRTVVSQAIA